MNDKPIQGSIDCDNCGKKLLLGDRVYVEPGHTYNACKPGCLAELRLRIISMRVAQRLEITAERFCAQCEMKNTCPSPEDEHCSQLTGLGLK